MCTLSADLLINTKHTQFGDGHEKEPAEIIFQYLDFPLPGALKILDTISNWNIVNVRRYILNCWAINYLTRDSI